MKPTIVVITSTFPRWKNDTDPPFVFELCKRLVDEFDVHVSTPMYPGATRYQCLEGVHVHRFRYFLPRFERLAGSTGILPTISQNRLYWILVPFFLLGALWGALKLSRTISPKIIHSHWLIPNGVIGVIISKLVNSRSVVTAHGADVFGLRGGVFDTLRQWVVRHSRATTAVSRALAEKLLPVKSGRDGEVVVIPMGVDKNLFKCERNNLIEPKLLFVGRLTKKKGVEYLIQAMHEVVKMRPDCNLDIVGSGEQETYLKSLTYRLGIHGNINFLGAIENRKLVSIYCNHKIFIAPSVEADNGDSEGFGLTIVEASMTGCLVITTDVGGINDIVEDGVTGLIVKQKDSSEIADKILYALENHNEMEQIACAARKRCIHKFDWLIVKKKYVEIFRTLNWG